jgi:hypothetical protein
MNNIILCPICWKPVSGKISEAEHDPGTVSALLCENEYYKHITSKANQEIIIKLTVDIPEIGSTI